MFGILVISPTIMKHEFGHPFIAKILDQEIHKGKRRIGGNHGARVIVLFQPPDNGVESTATSLTSLSVAKYMIGIIDTLGAGVSVSRHHMSVPAQNIRHAAKPQYGEHLSRIG